MVVGENAALAAGQYLLFQQQLPSIKTSQVEQWNLLVVAVFAARIFAITNDNNPLFEIYVGPLDLADFFPAHGSCDSKTNDTAHSDACVFNLNVCDAYFPLRRTCARQVPSRV